MSYLDMSTLGEDYPLEQARLRELLEAYRAIGPAGSFGLMVIAQTLRLADEASASGDAVAIIRCYQKMRECK